MAFAAPVTPDAASPSPWIRESQFQELLRSAEPHSAVVLTDGSGQPKVDDLSLGKALALTLLDRTRSFTALVGYFGHKGHSAATDDPAAIVLNELEELFNQRTRSVEAPPRFRLLFGQIASDAVVAQLAARTWYWLCRWHAWVVATKHRDAGSIASSLEQLSGLGDALSREELRSVAVRLMGGPVCAGVAEAVSPLALFASGWAEGTPGYSPTGASGLSGGGPRAASNEDIDIFRAWRESLGRFAAAKPDSPEGRDFATCSEFLLFLLTHAGEVRVVPPGEKVSQIGIFHAKMYVIQRDVDDDATTSAGAGTVAFVGSGNWTANAFSHGAPRINTEVATIHSWPGGVNAAIASDTLVGRVASTARTLFERGTPIGLWDAGQSTDSSEFWGSIPTAQEVWHWTEMTTSKGVSTQPAPPVNQQPDLEVAAALQSMLRRTLGFPKHAVGKDECPLDVELGGQTPESYQIEGAQRLLALLRQDAPLPQNAPDAAQPLSLPSRGVFLTDEAGLGKTLIAEVVVRQLVIEKLLARDRANDDRELCVTFLAPKQLVGAKGSSRGWTRYSQAVEEAVNAFLLQRAKETGPEATALAATDRAERLCSQMQFKVLSVSDIARKTNGGRQSDALDDLVHLARSEVVVIDEAHNLRNGTSRKARMARMMLSLPAPGEAWPLVLPGSESTNLDLTGAQPRYCRKVICLSATPFNNELEDLITQVGHFAAKQDWSKSAQTQRLTNRQTQLLEANTVETPSVREALIAWHRSKERTDCTKALQVIMSVIDSTEPASGAAVRPFFASTRALNSRLMQSDRDATAQAIADAGPGFAWGPGYELGPVFGPIQTYLDPDRKAVSASAQTDDKEAMALAIYRLDTLLASLFVQRSRSRVLQMIDETRRGDMFRAPSRPRIPLAIGPATNSRASDMPFEAKILGQLQALLEAVRGDGQFRNAERVDGLALTCYRLGMLRKATGSNASSDALSQSDRNQFGFIIVNLVKRLQSSPYAFLRTLVAGPLRASLRWVSAAAQFAVDSGLVSQDRRWAAALSARGSLTNVLESLPAHARAGLAGLLGGKHDLSGDDLLASLIGVDETAESKRYGELLAEIGKAAGEARPPVWLEALLTDLGQGTAGGLYSDAKQCIEWCFGSGISDSRGLYGQIFPEPNLLNRSLPCSTMAEVRTDLARAKPWSVQEVKRWDAWLEGRLRQDPRVANLLGWLTIQALARGPAADLPDASIGVRIAKRLNSGAKSLIFSEYVDTIDYVCCVVLAMGNLAQSDDFSGAPLGSVALLTDAIRSCADSLRQQVVGLKNFESPIVHRTWLAWESAASPQVANAPTAMGELRAALIAIREETAICTGEVQTRLNDERSGPTSKQPQLVDELEIDGDAEESGKDIANAPVLDAFSPYYQIAPADQLRDARRAHAGDAAQDDALQETIRKLGDQLRVAGKQPVHALFATQVLAEGVNLQECGVVVHYDLPWNPTSLIQRNGRVDRRISRTYESDPERRDMLVSLKLAADPHVPDFVAPKQVYHLTVAPPEPEVSAASGSVDRVGKFSTLVRKTLFEKLSSIKKLFGLSNWPVVFDTEGAKSVLTGELTFETPGIRRREVLFKQWHDLSVMLSDAPVPPGSSHTGPGTIVFRGPRELSADVAARMADTVPGEWPTRALAAAVWTWTPWHGLLRPARSGIEWRGRNAISSWLLAAGAKAPGELFAWTSREAGTPMRIVPTWTRIHLSPKGRWKFEFVHGTSGVVPGVHGARPDGASQVDACIAGAPTSWSEEWLAFAVERFLERRSEYEFVLRNGLHLPEGICADDGTVPECGLVLEHFLNDRQKENASLQPGGVSTKIAAGDWLDMTSDWNLLFLLDADTNPRGIYHED